MILKVYIYIESEVLIGINLFLDSSFVCKCKPWVKGWKNPILSNNKVDNLADNAEMYSTTLTELMGGRGKTGDLNYSFFGPWGIERDNSNLEFRQELRVSLIYYITVFQGTPQHSILY